MNTQAQTELLAALYEETQQRFASFDDPAHGWEHTRRVYRLAQRICEEERADLLIVSSATLLHDIGRLIPRKGVPHALLSVEEAGSMLRKYQLAPWQVEAIMHAIEAHSFSQGIEPQTLEARILRDADRLDSLGAIGILRWAISGTIKRKNQTRSYHPSDPFAEWRQPDDRLYLLDRFYTRLLRLEKDMYTTTGRALAEQRTEYMRAYLREFKAELEL